MSLPVDSGLIPFPALFHRGLGHWGPWRSHALSSRIKNHIEHFADPSNHHPLGKALITLARK